MATKPKPPEHWYVFAITDLSILYDFDYPVACVCNSATGAVTDATKISYESKALIVGILHPDGHVGRVGHGNYLAMIPPALTGQLIRRSEGDYVRLLAPSA